MNDPIGFVAHHDAATMNAACDCPSCVASRAYQYGGLRCCPRKRSHGMNCICGASSLSPQTPPHTEGE